MLLGKISTRNTYYQGKIEKLFFFPSLAMPFSTKTGAATKIEQKMKMLASAASLHASKY